MVAQELSKQTHNHLHSKARPSAARDAPDADGHTCCSRAGNGPRASSGTERDNARVSGPSPIKGLKWRLGTCRSCWQDHVSCAGMLPAQEATFLGMEAPQRLVQPSCTSQDASAPRGRGGGEPAPTLRAVLLGSQLVSA